MEILIVSLAILFSVWYVIRTAVCKTKGGACNCGCSEKLKKLKRHN